MVGDPGARVPREAERRLQLGAAGEDRRRGAPRQRQARRHVAARAAQQHRAPVGDPDHRVVGAGADRPVVEQDLVGDPGEPRLRVAVLERDRLVGDVARGHHERHAEVGEQQVVQRRVGEHQPELARARGDGRRDRRAVPPRREHDRPLARAQQPQRLVAQLDEARRGRDVPDHQRERLLLAVLARAQRRHRPLVRGHAGEVEAAEALEREHAALAQAALRRLQRGPQPRAAVRAGDRLRVEAPVAGVGVLGAAGGAHAEAGHRRVRPVVGDAAHDREARAAVGAVQERVAEAPVGRVEQLAQAVLAGGDVGGDERGRGPAARGLDDLEAGRRQRLDGLREHPLDDRQRRRVVAQAGEERRDALRRPLHLHQHAALVVEHEPVERQLAGEPVHERPEADPLHHALHPRAGADHPTSSRSTWYALAWASWIRGMCWERVITTWSARPPAAISPPS